MQIFHLVALLLPVDNAVTYDKYTKDEATYFYLLLISITVQPFK